LLERLASPQLPIRRMVMTGRCVVRGSTGARKPDI
ncbi:LacI family transcriptional regulator, partial [Xanthomonas campestris pv. raphani]|nr:LacI family transcriptional regulator [Xanthomonas campestris pv. raphani]